MKRTKHKPLLSEESIANLKFIRLNGCEVRKNNECEAETIIHIEKPMRLGVGIWLFTNIQDKTNYRDIIDRDDEISYLHRVIDKIVNKVLEENPNLKRTHLRIAEYVHYRHYGEFVADIDFKKKFFLKRLFSKKK